MKSDLIELAYSKSIDLLRRSSRKEGFVASPAFTHYSIWARDAFITSIGANLSGDAALIKTARATLETFAKLQTPLGQVPDAYWPDRKFWDWGEAGCTDATAWFIIAASNYFKTTNDMHYLKSIWPNIKKAFIWLTYQDSNNTGLIDSPEAGDWMDSTLNRSGKVCHNNALYFAAAVGINEMARELGDNFFANAENIKKKFNILFWPEKKEDYSKLLGHVNYPKGADTSFPHTTSLKAYDAIKKPRKFYLSSVSYGNFVDKCDVLANSLANLFEISDIKKSKKILDYFEEIKIANPYPVRCWDSPVTSDDNTFSLLKSNADKFQAKQWKNPPGNYHNGAVWPYIGGFYALALLKAGKKKLAESALLNLARANKLGKNNEWGFHEWIHATKGTPEGASDQTWNAGSFAMAYQVIIKGKALPW
ncbi:MAG: amylo-alpha-1,6-glucosidase [Nanoarchaeota archaeon]